MSNQVKPKRFNSSLKIWIFCVWCGVVHFIGILASAYLGNYPKKLGGFVGLQQIL